MTEEENTENIEKNAAEQIQEILNGNENEVKSKKSFHLFGKKSKNKRKESVETTVKIRTITDIPPIAETRRSVGNKDIRNAVFNATNFILTDLQKNFGISLSGNLPLYAKVIEYLKKSGLKFTGEALVDRETFRSEISNSDKNSKEKGAYSQIAMKKFAWFILEDYFPVKYSGNEQLDGNKIISDMVDIYNYMDLKKLYIEDGQ